MLDFSSASEDEDPCCSRQKSSNPHTGEEMGPGDSSIGNIGLYRLLQQHITQREERETDSSEEDSSNPSKDEKNQETPCQSEAVKHHESRGQTKSEHTSHVLPSKLDKRNHGMNAGKSRLSKGVKFTERSDIESFSSSEDELHDERVKCRRGSFHQVNRSPRKIPSEGQNTKQSVRFTGVKNQNTTKTPESDKTHCRDDGNTGTIDSLLGITFTLLIEVVCVQNTVY